MNLAEIFIKKAYGKTYTQVIEVLALLATIPQKTT
jgi:hypothetical protein